MKCRESNERMGHHEFMASIQIGCPAARGTAESTASEDQHNAHHSNIAEDVHHDDGDDSDFDPMIR